MTTYASLTGSGVFYVDFANGLVQVLYFMAGETTWENLRGYGE